MHPIAESQRQLARREFFGRASTGVGVAALASLLGRDSVVAGDAALAGLPGLPHLAPQAKRVIYLFQNGAPTHVDLFDWKPRLRELHGKPLPAGYADGKRFSTMTGQADGKLMLAPVEPFRQRGESGAWVSDFLPYTAGIADRLCFVHSRFPCLFSRRQPVPVPLVKPHSESTPSILALGHCTGSRSRVRRRLDTVLTLCGWFSSHLVSVAGGLRYIRNRSVGARGDTGADGDARRKRAERSGRALLGHHPILANQSPQEEIAGSYPIVLRATRVQRAFYRF